MVWVQTGRSLFLILIMGVAGLLILWRKSRDWFGLYLAFAFLAQGVGGGNLARPLLEQFSGYKWVYDTLALGAISWQFFFIIFYFFPNGKPVPRWSRWLALAWVGFITARVISPEMVDTTLSWLAFPFVFSALGSQIYRYFWRADAVQRQQTKWIMVAVVVVLVMVGLIAPGAFESPTGLDYGPPLIQATIVLLGLNLSFLLIPIAITISILFYRLWDIDIIIRKTVQYGVLTAVLGLVYYGSVLLLQGLFTRVTGEKSAVALVLSTLLIAALFTPLRRRIQEFIDRRFFRKKYDAAQVLAQFAQTAQNETDMEALQAELLRVVQETMQPETVSIWVKK
jgi:hypothetical protein